MIFSDNYTVHERYSLVSGERLSDFDEMPWLYTPLVDGRYNPPNIPESAKDILNKTLGYEYYLEDVETNKEEEKHLGIYHLDGEIQSYRSRFRLRYSKWRKERGHFIRSTLSTTTNDLYDRMAEVVTATPEGTTAFVGAEHDVDGYITGLMVVDRDYNLSMYNNPLLDKVSWYSKNAPNFCRGVLTVRPDDVVSFYSEFVYPKQVSIVDKTEYRKDPRSALKNKNLRRISYRQSMGKHLAGYRLYEILNEDQIRTIIEELVPNTETDAMIQIEHVFQGSELLDIIIHVVKYKNFEEIQVPRKWMHVFDENGQRLW